jgi:hypothetical protein
MKRLLLATVFAAALGIPGWAADAPEITFSKTFPGSNPPYFQITVDPSGAATYNETTDLEASTASAIFALADRLDHFKKPLESGLKVANMGEKKLRWQHGGEISEVKFNYSTSEDAKALADWFERIADSTRLLVELRRAIKHDRLGVNAGVVNAQTLWNNKRLVGTPDYLPLLDQIAKNEAFLHMARERAAQIADAIRASAK